MLAQQKEKWNKKGLAASDTVRALDKMLQSSLGWGLHVYMPEQRMQMGGELILKPENAADRPTLVLVPDELKTGVQAAQYLLGLGLRASLGRDPCHRDWNDAKRGIERADMWGACRPCYAMCHVVDDAP